MEFMTPFANILPGQNVKSGKFVVGDAVFSPEQEAAWLHGHVDVSRANSLPLLRHVLQQR